MNDLEWLARNVHEWGSFPIGSRKIIKYSVVSNLSESVARIDNGAAYTKHEWQAERQRLQNKPSWDDAPDWAEWLAQQQNGVWVCFKSKPVIHEIDGSDWYCHEIDKHGAEHVWHSGIYGEVLSDWRETLEHRPSKAAEQPENVKESALDDACDIIQECYYELKRSRDHLDAAQDSLNVAKDELATGLSIAQAAIDRIDRVLKG